MSRWTIQVGAVSAFVGVAMGAFAAHFLKRTLDPEAFAIFEVGVRYQMYHALGLIGVGLVRGAHSSRLLRHAGCAMIAGTILFSGSLYALALTGLRGFGAVTPFGGVAFLVGWALLVLGLFGSSNQSGSSGLIPP